MIVVLSQDKMTLIEITGKTIKIEASWQGGGYGIIAYDNPRDKDSQVILGEYSSKTRAQEVLYNIWGCPDGYEMPVN